MTALAFRWRRPDPPIALRWRGLDDVTFDALAAGCDPEAIAAIIGPPGLQGEQGDPGPPGTVPDPIHGGFF